MSTAHEWDFTVPDDDDELLAELRRHGADPGKRIHVAIANDLAASGKKRQSVRGILVGKIPSDELLTTDDFEAVHQANVEAAERRFGQMEQ